MNVFPLQRVGNSAPGNFKTRIRHRRITDNIELDGSCRIGNQLVCPLLFLIQETYRERGLQIEHGKAVRTKFRHVIYTHLQGYRIRVRHVREERIVRTAVQREPSQTDARRVKRLRRVRTAEDINKRNIRKRIRRHREIDFARLGQVTRQRELQHVRARSKGTVPHNRDRINYKASHVRIDFDSSDSSRQNFHAIRRNPVVIAKQHKHGLRKRRIDMRRTRHVTADRFVHEQLQDGILDGPVNRRFFHRIISLLRLQVDGRTHLEIRTRCVAFREENVERVFAPFDKLQRRVVLPDCIQVHASLYRAVAPANINDKAVIDKDPDVIIATEFEILSLHVLELRRDLHRKAVIVATPANLPVKFRIRYCSRRIEILEIVNRIKSWIDCIVAVAFLVREVRLPKAFFVQGQTNIAAHTVLVFIARGILRNHLRNKPLLDFVRSRTLVPRIN